MDRRTVATYDAGASVWAQRRGPARDDIGAAFRRRVGPGRIVDLGCGSGRYLGQLGPGVVGLDATTAMLDLARPQGAPLVRGDLEALPFPSSCAAGLFARHSYLHLPRARLPAALAEARRVLVAGGSILVSVIEGTYEGHQLPDDDLPGRWFALWSAADLAAALAGAGFDGVEVGRVHHPRGGPDLVATAQAGGRSRRRPSTVRSTRSS